MTEDDIVFPALCFHGSTLFTSRSLDALTRTTSAAVRGGLYSALKIIDSTGREIVVEKATRRHGVGPFWGFNIFLNRRVRVELDVRETGKTLAASEVRSLVLRDLRNWHGWQTRGDFEVLKASIEAAGTADEIIRLVSQ